MELNENAMSAVILLVIVWYLGMVMMAIRYGGQVDSYCKNNVCSSCDCSCILRERQVISEPIV